MTALATERPITLQNQFRYDHKPLPLENAVKCYRGGLAGYYISGATKGEVAPFKIASNMIGLGVFMETVDNASDGKTVQVSSGISAWVNGTDPVVASDLGDWVYGLDDQTVSRLGYTPQGTPDPVINTITPTAANSTPYALQVEYKLPGDQVWRVATLPYVSDASATATEICDGLRAALLADYPELNGSIITATGTTTLILTAQEGVAMRCRSVSTGVLTIVVTDAGTVVPRSKAGQFYGISSYGVMVLSHPMLYPGLDL